MKTIFKMLLSVLFVLFVCIVSGYSQEDSKQIMADQDAYLVMRTEATKLFESKQYVDYSTLMLKIADCAHSKRFPGVHAWGLNNAGYGYILAGKFCEAKAILVDAVKIEYDNEDWKDKVERNLNCATVNCKEVVNP